MMGTLAGSNNPRAPTLESMVRSSLRTRLRSRCNAAMQTIFEEPDNRKMPSDARICREQ
jgi:hypothetical protein